MAEAKTTTKAKATSKKAVEVKTLDQLKEELVKLQNDYRRPRFIATVPGRGYRFVPTFTNRGWDRPATPEGPASS